MPSLLQQITESIAGFNPESLRVEVAQRAIADCIQPITDTEHVPLKQALGRTLARAVISPINVPAHNNSAMDGYAFRGADLARDSSEFIVVGKAFAGHPYQAAVQAGECVRIMTGAVIPDGCDSVIPQELIHAVNPQTIRIEPGVIQAGLHLRLAGEDLRVGTVALQQGRCLTPADLGLLASLGIAEVVVIRRLRVAFFSTGDELRSIGQPLDTGCLYDSNRYTLHAMLERANFTPLDLGVVRDDPVSLEATLRDACQQADVIITTGGVSAGDADHTRAMMARLGEVLFWKIAMRPGRPMAFGQITVEGKTALLFGLPGNPVAVMATFYFFARDALFRLQGTSAYLPPIVRAITEQTIAKRPGRTEFQRGVLSFDASGNAQVRLTGAQGSGILSSMSDANCMVVLGHNEGDIQAGQAVNTIPFSGLL